MLPFPVFVRTICLLLTRLGYQNVGPVKKMPKKGRGRNAHGGLDIEATLPQGLVRTRVIAQVKQYSRPVPRSFVDELRGTMLRQGAQQGLLITTATFSPTAKEAAAALSDSLPIRLVEGAELLRLLTAQGISLPTPRESVPVSAPRADKADARATAVAPVPNTLAMTRPVRRADKSKVRSMRTATSNVTITLTLGTPAESIALPDDLPDETPDRPAR